jgi:hypothetical protein
MKQEMTVFQCDLPRCSKRRISPILPKKNWVQVGDRHYCCAAHARENENHRHFPSEGIMARELR